MSKSIRKILYSTLAVFMAVVMAALSPVRIFAVRGAGGSSTSGSGSGSTTSQNLYIKDIIIVTESEKDNLKKIEAYQSYTLINKPLYTFDADDDEHETLYLAVSTTSDPNEGITDIKAMNMNGDYDYKAYADYLAQFERWAEAKAQTTLAAVKEFQANYLYNKPSAVFAYNMLNYLTEDGETSLGDAFVCFDDAALLKTIYNIVLKSNLAMLEYIRQLLLIACSETQEKDFVTALLEHGKDNPLINGEYSQYNTAATDLINSLVATSRMINAYRDAQAQEGDSLNSYIEEENAEISKTMTESDEFSENYLNADDKGDILKDIASGEILCTLFDEIYYEDDDENKYRLSDILAMDPTAEDPAKRPAMDMILPIVALMSEGQRGLAGCGFDKLVGSVINEYNSQEAEAQEALEEIQGMWDTAGNKKLISVYAGVDLSLYDPNGIAMVGTAKQDADKAENTPKNFLGLPTYATAIMLGGAAVGIVGSVAVFKHSFTLAAQEAARVAQAAEAAQVAAAQRANDIIRISEALDTYKTAARNFKIFSQAETDMMYNGMLESVGTQKATYRYALAMNQNKLAMKQMNNTIAKLEKELSGLQNTTATATKVSNAAIISRAFSTFMFVFSIALFIVSLIALIQELTPEEEQDATYIDVPRVLVNSIEYEEYDERLQKTTKKQMIFYKGIIDPFMSEDKANEHLTPSKVMDVFDWSLKGSHREWIALYATRDGRAGNPILANDIQDSLAILIETPTASYTSLMQGYNDRVKIFGKTGYVECGSGVIAFNHGTTPSDTKSGLGYSASMTIESGAFILFLLLAAMGGAGIAVLSCFLINKRNKKKETA